MESTKQPQSVAFLDEIDANSPPQSLQDQIESLNVTNVMRVGEEMESTKCMSTPRRSFVNPEFVEILQELADQFDAHEKYEEEALDLISGLYEQMALVVERGDNLSALTQLKNRIGELKYLLYYNQLVVSHLFNAKHELIEIALCQNELALYYHNEMGVELTSGVSSSECKSEFRHGCCFAMLVELRAWASKVGKWILNLLCLSRKSVQVQNS